MKASTIGVIVAGLSLAAINISSAWADVITTFVLDDVTFTDGTTATGSFQFDGTNDTLSNVSIETSGGSGLLALTFTGAVAADYSPGLEALFEITDIAGNGDPYQLDLYFYTPLSLTTNDVLGPGSDEQDEYAPDAENHRTISSGSLDPVGVPEPASLALLASGLAILGLLRRRRRWKAPKP